MSKKKRKIKRSDLFISKVDGELYMMTAESYGHRARLVCLNDGEFWGAGVNVKDIFDISQKEFHGITVGSEKSFMRVSKHKSLVLTKD